MVVCPASGPKAVWGTPLKPAQLVSKTGYSQRVVRTRCEVPERCVDYLISHKVSSKSFCRGQFPHKSVNVSFTFANIKNQLTDSCGN